MDAAHKDAKTLTESHGGLKVASLTASAREAPRIPATMFDRRPGRTER